LLELTEEKSVHLSSISTLVLDEADKMLNLGFKEEMNRIFKQLPAKRQNLLFSATLSPDIKDMERVLLNDPSIIQIITDKEEEILINQSGYAVEPEQKGQLLRYVIKHFDMQQVLVFASSVYQADLVSEKLRRNGIQAKAIHSKKSQGARQEALNSFKNGTLRVLVSTDLLARGIDIEFLPFVINYELPRSPKDFTHRIGRTGRAENPGEAITFVTPEDMHHFKVILKKTKAYMPLFKAEELDLQGY
jgi:ATP-dependent RNA helicase RhlE